MKSLHSFLLVLALVLVHSFNLSAQTLNANGSTHTINVDNGTTQYQGSAQDYTIPSNTDYNSIRFTLKGGDGGYAEVGNCKSDGGEGATVEAVFWIGNGTNELRPGGTIRFIVGKHGHYNSNSVPGDGLGGGGGGGTAVLYRPTSTDPWVMLAVAGGGGGAYQGNLFDVCYDSQQGAGGNAVEVGSAGEGTNAGSGGINGGGGGTHGGGGYLSDGEDPARGGGKGYPGGGSGGTYSVYGGWGFGGGGGGGAIGFATGTSSGGGGGGYSGGGGGGVYDNGGGGGSYIHAGYAISNTKTAGAKGGGTFQNGHVDYTFEAIAFTWTGAIDHNWHNSGNWSPTQVPTSANIVEIPAAVNDPYILPGSPAEARFVRVLSGGALTVQSNGILNLYPVNSNGISNYGTITNMGGDVNIARYDGNANNDGILNEGGLFRNMSGGEINIEGMDRYGILNKSGATFDNQTASTINIGTASSQISSDGIRNETNSDFTNFGTLNIRNTGSHGITNSGDFTNNPGRVINIDQTTGDGIRCSYGTFTNDEGEINIGELATIGGAGIGLYNAATFMNNSFGVISMWQATNNGVYLEAATMFENRGHLFIGGLGGPGIAGDAGVLINGIFTNFAGGQLFVDQTVEDGILVSPLGHFHNYQTITIGSITVTGGNGIKNQGFSNNYSAGKIFIIRSGNHGIYNREGVFTNEGLIEIGENGNIGSQAIHNGSPGGEAYFENNSCSAVIHLFDKNIADEEDRFINSGTILQESSASSYINTNNGTIFYNAGSFTVGSGSAPLSVTGTLDGKKLWTACAGNGWFNSQNWSPNGAPIASDEVIIYPVGVNPLIPGPQTGQSKSVYIEDGAGLVNNSILHVTDGDFTIDPTAVVSGNGQYFLSGNFTLNGGTFTPGTSTVTLNGTGNQHISPDLVAFYKLTIDKASGDALIGMGSITVSNELNMVAGNIDLNGNDIELTGNGIIIGEDAASYIYSTSGGVVKKTLDLNAPTTVNPGNIGASISSFANLGSTTIQRGHGVQDVNGQASILRYYDISPANNSGLSATLRFHYLDHELNGIAENELYIYRFNNTDWDNYPVSTADVSANWMETGNVDAFSRWTLSTNCIANITFYADTDGDGYGDPLVTIMDCAAPAGYVTDNTDCNDGDDNEFPGQTWYEDADNDGYSTGSTQTACERPAGYKLADELVNPIDIDCNDMNGAINPGATESCNGIDDNCNSQTDEGLQSTFYADTDGDGYGDPDVTVMDCAAPAGYVTDNTDCNDGDGKEFPGQTWYEDADNDGYSNGSTQTACERPAGYKLADELVNPIDIDCNDMNGAINPGATESCNGIDDNCNSQTDEGLQSTFYADTDGDGYGDPAVTVMDCGAPAGYVTDNTDCNDGDADEFPGQTWYEDADNDGYSTGTTQTACERPIGFRTMSELANTTDIDCNDNDANANPNPNCAITTRTWTGHLSTDWDEACNWSPNCMPTANDDVIIPDVGNDPVISATSVVAVKSVTVNAGGALTISSGGNLSIDDSEDSGLVNNGTVTNMGTIDIGHNTAIDLDGIINTAQFTNDGGIIDIRNTYQHGIRNHNAGDFFNQNGGVILIGTNGGFVSNYGINNRGDGTTFTNDAGTIDIENAGFIGVINVEVAQFNNLNGSQLLIGQNNGSTDTGIENDNGATLINDASTIRIDNASSSSLGNYSSSTIENRNGALIVLEQINPTSTYGLLNLYGGIFNNMYCSSLLLYQRISNKFGATFLNEGLFYINTDDNTSQITSTFTNNGIVQDVQGTLPSITNNEIIVAPVTTSDCSAVNPAFGLGTPVDFNILGVFTDAAATQLAGSYNLNTNTFTPNNNLPTGATVFYVKIEDPVGGCTRIVQWDVNSTGTLVTCYLDSDGDTYGDAANSQIFCDVCGTGYVLDNTDCNDADEDEFPGQTWYPDGDNDGYRGGAVLIGCARPAGFKTADELINTTDIDCNDGDPNVFMNQTWFEDMDDDGFYSGTLLISCNRPSGFKLASELVNTTDVDCDDTDADEYPGQTWYLDADGDDYSDGTSVSACERPANHFLATELTDTEGDCDDNDPAINPEAVEVCDGIDNNCNGSIDEPLAIESPWANSDVGAPGVNGNASIGCSGSSSVYNLSASSFSTSSSDKLHLVYQTLCGNGEIIARVLNVTNGGWAGITFRESLAPGSKKAVLKTQLTSIIRREIRNATNGPSNMLNLNRPQHIWLRLVRNGGNFEGYTSFNGQNWGFAFSANISMSGCIYAGFFAESINVNVTTNACFDNVSIIGSNGIEALSGGGVAPHDAYASSPSTDFEVYPNPTGGELNLNLAQYIGRSVRIETYSLQGNLLQFSEVDEVQNTLESLDLSRFENGLFLVKVKSEGLPDATRRVVLQRR